MRLTVLSVAPPLSSCAPCASSVVLCTSTVTTAVLLVNGVQSVPDKNPGGKFNILFMEKGRFLGPVVSAQYLFLYAIKRTLRRKS